MPLHIFAAFEWSNEDLIFVTSLVEDLRVFGRVEHQSGPQQEGVTWHKIQLHASPATTGRVIDLFAGVAEAGALVKLEIHPDEAA